MHRQRATSHSSSTPSDGSTEQWSTSIDQINTSTSVMSALNPQDSEYLIQPEEECEWLNDDRQFMGIVRFMAVLMWIVLAGTKALWNIAAQNGSSPLGFSKNVWGWSGDVAQSILCINQLLLYFSMTESTVDNKRMWRILKNSDKAWMFFAVSGCLLVSVIYFDQELPFWGVVMFFVGLEVAVPVGFEITDTRRYDLKVAKESYSYLIFAVGNVVIYLSFFNDAIVTPNEIVSVLKTSGLEATEYSIGQMLFVLAIDFRVFLFSLLWRNFVRVWELRWLAQRRYETISESERIAYQNVVPRPRLASSSSPISQPESGVSENLRYANNKNNLWKYLAVIAILVFSGAEFFITNHKFWAFRGCCFCALALFMIVWGLALFLQRRRMYFQCNFSWTGVYLLGRCAYGAFSFMYEVTEHRLNFYRWPTISEWSVLAPVACIVMYLNLCCTRILPDSEVERQLTEDELTGEDGGLEDDLNEEKLEEVDEQSDDHDDDAPRGLDRSASSSCCGCFGYRNYLVVSEVYNRTLLWRILFDVIMVTAKIYSHDKIHIDFWSRLLFCLAMLSTEFHLELVKMAKVIDEIMHNEKLMAEYEEVESLGGFSAESFVLYGLKNRLVPIDDIPEDEPEQEDELKEDPDNLEV